MIDFRPRARFAATAAVTLILVTGGIIGPGPATASATADHAGGLGRRLSESQTGGPGFCPPRSAAYHFSDALDKVSYAGATVGGLSDIAYDPELGSLVSAVDNHADDPSRLWFYRDVDHPRIWRDPLVLKAPDGIPYTGITADNEGLAVLPDGRFLVSSETEPSIRIFGTDGVQQSELSVPNRFRVAPDGEATANATLEGLTITPDGHTIVAAMEGTLSGDAPADGSPASFRRFLVYTEHAGHYRLTKQLGYTVDEGLRISEVQAYTNSKLLITEAAYAPATGNTVKLYAVTDGAVAPDVSGIANLSAKPNAVTRKTLVANVTNCPTLGATAKQVQANPLMDNYEGMITKPIGHHIYQLVLISDDNFGATQITRTLDLVALLP